MDIDAEAKVAAGESYSKFEANLIKMIDEDWRGVLELLTDNERSILLEKLQELATFCYLQGSMDTKNAVCKVMSK